MSCGYNAKKFREEILRNSVSTVYSIAVLEWTFKEYYKHDDITSCICEQFPIKHIYVIENERSGIELEVGCVCIEKFMEDIFIPLHVMKALDKMKKAPDAVGATKSMLEFAHLKNIINDEFKRIYETEFGGTKRFKREHKDFNIELVRKRALMNLMLLDFFDTYRKKRNIQQKERRESERKPSTLFDYFLKNKKE